MLPYRRGCMCDISIDIPEPTAESHLPLIVKIDYRSTQLLELEQSSILPVRSRIELCIFTLGCALALSSWNIKILIIILLSITDMGGSESLSVGLATRFRGLGGFWLLWGLSR